MVVQQPLSVMMQNARKIPLGGTGSGGGSKRMHGGDDDEDDDDDDVRHVAGSGVIIGTIMPKTSSSSSSGTIKANDIDKKKDLEKLFISSIDKLPPRHGYTTTFTHQL